MKQIESAGISRRRLLVMAGLSAGATLFARRPVLTDEDGMQPVPKGEYKMATKAADHSQIATVSMTPVSRDSMTIAGEPELYLSTPEPEVSSAVFTFAPGAVSQWMVHPAPLCIYVLEGTLLVEFEDGSHQSFHAGQAFLQCRSKWHRGRNDSSQTMRFLAVFFGAKGVPNVVHPPEGTLVD
jgi:quercetin dioxygenase-like cupin family protein